MTHNTYKLQRIEDSSQLFPMEEVHKQPGKIALNKAYGSDDQAMDVLKIIANYTMDHLTEPMTLWCKTECREIGNTLISTNNIQRQS